MELDVYKLGEHKLSPDEFVFLYFLVYPDIHSEFPSIVDHKKLEEKGFIKIGPDETYYARGPAVELVKEDIRVKEEESIKVEEKPKISADLETVSEWIPDWRSLFPMGVKTGGYSVRGTRGGCVKKMKKFLKSNPEVTKAQVFAATEKYIADKQMVSFAYMKLADYFIEKDGGSLLEEYVEQIKQGKTLEQTELFFPGVQTNSGDLTDDI